MASWARSSASPWGALEPHLDPSLVSEELSDPGQGPGQGVDEAGRLAISMGSHCSSLLLVFLVFADRLHI